MTPTLSICIPLLNDPVEIVETIKSIRATSPAHLQICVADDASTVPFTTRDPHVQVKRFNKRIGCGKTRWAAVQMATGSHFLNIDSHMRFEPGWYEKAMARIERSPLTTFCAVCPHLSALNMDIAKAKHDYRGATLCFIDHTPGGSPHKKVLEGKWRRHTDNEEMACLMGACYFFPRDVFLKLEGTRDLMDWGTLEPFVSLKLWLAGYEIRLAGDVKIGHKYRDAAPYTMHLWKNVFNKCMAIYTLFGDSDPAMAMLGKLKSVTAEVDWKLAMAEVTNRSSEILSTHARYQGMFTRDLQWYCDHFKIPLPTI